MKNLFTRLASPKFHVKAACFFVCAAGILWYTADLWTQRKLPYLESALTAVMQRPVTIEKAHYNPFYGILLDGVDMKGDTLQTPFHIRRARILTGLYWRSGLGLKIGKLVFENPTTTLRMPLNNRFDPAAILRNLTAELGTVGALKIRMDASLLEVRQGKIVLDTSGENKAKLWFGPSEIRYSFTAVRKGTAVKFKTIVAQIGPILLKGTGAIDLSDKTGSYQCSLSSGKVPLDRFKDLLPSVLFASGEVRFLAEVSGDVSRYEPSLDVEFYNGYAYGLNEKVSVENLEGLVRLSKKRVEINEFQMTVNDVPVRVNALWLDKRRFVMKASTSPGTASSGLAALDIVGASLKAEGVWLKDGWGGSAQFKTRQPGAGGNNVLALTFQRLDSQSCGPLKLRWRHWIESDDSVIFSLNRLAFALAATRNELTLKVSDTSLKEGNARFKLGLRFAKPTCEISSSLTDVNVSKILHYVRKSYPINGRLSASIFWSGKRNGSRGNGVFKITNGTIGPSEPLARLARQTGIEAFSAIRFDVLEGRINYENGIWQLKNFRLLGNKLRIGANLKVNAERASGLLSVKVLASSINESSDLRWLRGFVGAEDWIDFDFKVAGYLASPRVQWLSGEFKKKIESRLAPWMRNIVTQHIEKQMSKMSAPTL